MESLASTESVCSEVAVAEFRGQDLYCSDSESLVSHVGMQFPKTTSSPWSFYSHALQMRLICTPSSVAIRGSDLIRLSVKSEIAMCSTRRAIRTWISDTNDGSLFWLSQGGNTNCSTTPMAGRKRPVDLDLGSWMSTAETRSKKRRLATPKTRHKS
ncbi:hypothetical protein BST61_g8502 [Cercospora zeina]